MSFRLIALDIDGTLLTSAEELSPRVRKAIKSAQQRGLCVTLATGRRFCRTQPWATALGLTVPVVVLNGAVVVNPESGQVVYKRGIELALATEVLSILDHSKINYVIYTGVSAGEHLEMPRGMWDVGHHVIMKYCGDSVQPVDQLDLSEPPIKIAVLDQAEKVRPVVEVLNNKLGGKLNIMVFGTDNAQWLGIEILDRQCTKASGVGRVVQDLGISFSEVLAIGDNINDIEMIEWAGLGIAMANAPKEVREIADYVAPSNDDDGVAQVIEEFVFAERS